MPRSARFTIQNGSYHVLSRGHSQKGIFHESQDFNRYLDILSDQRKTHSVSLHHYCLMANYAHMIVSAPDGQSLSRAMRSVNQRYAQYYRKKYGGAGYLWQDRFKSYLIQPGVHLLTAGRYVEYVPVTAGTCLKPEEYAWSSYNVYAHGHQNSHVEHDAEYLKLSGSKEERMAQYRAFMLDGQTDRRRVERYFKQGARGDKEFIEALKTQGLKPVWSHKGRPKKKK